MGPITAGPNLNTTTDDPSRLRLTLPARAENVAVVRHALAGLAERLGMDDESIADLKTVVTEACMNVVVHAYPDGEEGPLEVEAESEPGGLTVAVRDRGGGIKPRPDTDRPSLRIGLTLIAALSSSFEIKGGAGRGTEIRMHIPLRPPVNGAGAVPDRAAAPGATAMRVGPPRIVGPVLSRVMSALAARNEITLDRLSDAMLLTDALADRAPDGFSDGHVELTIADRPQGVEMRIGPMVPGGAERLRRSLRLPEVGSLEALADELRVDDGGDGEYLVVSIAALAA